MVEIAAITGIIRAGFALAQFVVAVSQSLFNNVKYIYREANLKVQSNVATHESALRWRNVTERDLFHQSVINANKEIFPIKWRKNHEFNAHSSKPTI